MQQAQNSHLYTKEYKHYREIEDRKGDVLSWNGTRDLVLHTAIGSWLYFSGIKILNLSPIFYVRCSLLFAWANFGCEDRMIKLGLGRLLTLS